MRSKRDREARREGEKITIVTPNVSAIDAANIAMLRKHDKRRMSLNSN
jgi:hypothetical protein